MDTVGTMRPGIFVAGTAIAPKDIPDSVASGESAAMRAFIETKKATTARARSR
jgi:heterodisulfide reductase subunit A